MTLHPELNNLTRLCNEITALNSACFNLSMERGATKNQMQKLMYELCRKKLEEDLEYNIRQLQRLLNNHYAKYQSSLFQSDKNDPRQVETRSDSTD